MNNEDMREIFDKDLIEYNFYTIEKNKKKKQILYDLNLLGAQGWEYCERLDTDTILLKRLRNFLTMINEARDILDGKEDENLPIENIKYCTEDCKFFDVNHEYCTKLKQQSVYGSPCMEELK